MIKQCKRCEYSLCLLDFLILEYLDRFNIYKLTTRPTISRCHAIVTLLNVLREHVMLFDALKVFLVLSIFNSTPLCLHVFARFTRENRGDDGRIIAGITR